MLRSLRAAAVAATVALLGTPGAARATDAVPAPEPAAPRIGGHFSLTAPDGTEVTDRSFPGKWLLLYFGYTFCPDACPTALNTIAEVLDELGTLAEQIQPIFITVDRQRDTPAVLAEYVKAFHPRLIGLTGSAVQISAAAKDFHVFHQVRNEDYAIDHSSYVYVIDPSGRVVDLITGNLPGHPVAAELQRLIQSG